MESNQNNFRNIIDPEPKKSSMRGFKKNIVVPFLSGVIGCSVVLGTCFGVPSIKEKIVGNSTVTTSSPSEKNSGLVEEVSLSKYSDTAVYAANKILPSIVGIKITYNVTTSSMFNMFGGGKQSTSESQASGSGIIISEDGYILTNNHVVDSSSESTYYDISEATAIKVVLSTSDKEYDAKIVGKDSQTDLAVLKIEAENLTAAEFANSDDVKVGEFAMAVGNPLGMQSSITCGVVSAVNREVTDSEGKQFTLIQTDAAINSGNSGGALVNSEGKVIGINTLKLSGTGIEGMGFAIPIEYAMSKIETLEKGEEIKWPQLGVQMVNVSDVKQSRFGNNYNIPNDVKTGVVVAGIVSGTGASKSDLKEGDIITKLNGEEVENAAYLRYELYKYAPGDTITLTYLRDGKEHETKAVLSKSE